MPNARPRLIVGLGNPGGDYAATRHNVGFMAADAIAEHTKCAAWKKKFKGQFASHTSPDFFLLKPETYMNLSGEAVGEAARFHKIPVEDVIVFHDDLDLAPGQVKIKQGGGSGGHNGLKSIDAHLGPDYWRVRLGIGRPASAIMKEDAVTNYVLGAFAKADQAWLKPLLAALAEEFETLLAGKHTDYLSRVTQKCAAK